MDLLRHHIQQGLLTLSHAASLLLLFLSSVIVLWIQLCRPGGTDNGRARRSPDRHDHHRGQRRKPTCPAGALIIEQNNRTEETRKKVPLNEIVRVEEKQ